MTIRSFVSTKDSADLHLWIPKADEVNMNAQVGNLGVFYDLDLADLKDALGIPQTEFIMSRTSLQQIGEQYNIPEEEIREFFKGFYTYNGWRTLITGNLYGTSFWAALARTLLITVVSLSLAIILSIFTGYGLSGLKRRDQMVVYNLYLLQMVIPAMLILLPQFLIIQWAMKTGARIRGCRLRPLRPAVGLHRAHQHQGHGPVHDDIHGRHLFDPQGTGRLGLH